MRLMKKLAVLVSARGTLLEAMLKRPDFTVDLVVAEVPCRGFDISNAAGVPTVMVARTDFGWKDNFDRAAFTKAVVKTLKDHSIDVVALSGFRTLFAAPMFTPEAYSGRVLNTHCSLLPSFPGAFGEKVIEQTLAAGVKITGCTVHLVTLEADAGAILAQAAVPVLPNDDVESLWERIKVIERQLYPETITKFMNGEIELS